MNPHFITGNKDKLREVEAILGLKVSHTNIDLDEIQSMNPHIVAKHKVLHAWEVVGEPVFVLDQSIYIGCLNGFPGPLIKWFWTEVGLEKICDIVRHYEDKSIYAESIVTYYDGEEVRYFSGTVQGNIPDKPRGDKGWGWDPIFIPDGYDKTNAEFEPEQVLDLRSHKVALEKFRDFLVNNNKNEKLSH